MTNTRKATILVALASVLALAGCGGAAEEDAPVEPAVLATADEVEDILASNEDPHEAPLNLTYSCVSEDYEGRRFQCLAEITPQPGYTQTWASFDVTCDGVRCQWTRYAS